MRTTQIDALIMSAISLTPRTINRLRRYFIEAIHGSGPLGLLFRRHLRRRYAASDLAQDKLTVRGLENNKFLPDYVLVQLSRRCNLTCSMCGWQVWKRNKGVMPIEIFERTLSEVVSAGIKNMSFTSAQGEPLLSPHAEQCINMAIDAGLNVHLNTNCTTLGERNIKMLADAASRGSFTIQASFSGYDKETHESVYKGSNFDVTSKKLASLYEAFRARGILDKLTINGIIMSADDKPKHMKYFHMLGIDTSRVRLGLPDNFGGIVQVGSKDRRRGIYSYKSSMPYRSLRLCGLLAYQLVVYDDGKVSACACRDSENVMEIGDITKQTFSEMRNGAAFQGMLHAFMTRNIDSLPLCKGCDIPYGDNYNQLV